MYWRAGARPLEPLHKAARGYARAVCMTRKKLRAGNLETQKHCARAFRNAQKVCARACRETKTFAREIFGKLKTLARKLFGTQTCIARLDNHCVRHFANCSQHTRLSMPMCGPRGEIIFVNSTLM